jgi:universal stress protein A
MVVLVPASRWARHDRDAAGQPLARALHTGREVLGVFKHILVPVDLGPMNRRALVTVRGLAQQGRTRVTLLHVIQRIEHVPFAELRRFYERVGTTVQKKMGAAVRRLARRKIPVRAEVLIGSPAREIVRYAAANRVDLIVLGSHRIDLAHPAAGWGTTSYKVGILCQCPVMLVK